MATAKNYIEICTDTFRNNGGRLTTSRLLVVKVLADSKKPLSAKQIFEKLDKKKLIDKASVYRTIDLLLELDLIHQIFPEGGFVACFHSSCSAKVHVLISCKICDAIEEIHIPNNAIDPLLNHIFTENKFKIDKDHFQISGSCKNCI